MIDTTFIKMYSPILSSNLTDFEKIFISYIISFQANNKICYESNPSIAKHLGKSETIIKRNITNLKKYDFFITEYPTSTTHILSIDIDKLNNFINEDEPKVSKKKPTSTAKANKEVLSNDIPVDEPTPQQEEIVAQSEDNIANWIDEEDEEEDEELKAHYLAKNGLTYDTSTIQFRLANGNNIYIADRYLELWEILLQLTGLINTLKKYTDEYLFNRELEKQYQQRIITTI